MSAGCGWRLRRARRFRRVLASSGQTSHRAGAPISSCSRAPTSLTPSRLEAGRLSLAVVPAARASAAGRGRPRRVGYGRTSRHCRRGSRTCLLGGDGEIRRSDELAAGGRGQAVHPGENGLRNRLQRRHELRAEREQLAYRGQVSLDHVAEVVTGAEDRPFGASSTPRASLAATWRTAAGSWRM